MRVERGWVVSGVSIKGRCLCWAGERQGRAGPRAQQRATHTCRPRRAGAAAAALAKKSDVVAAQRREAAARISCRCYWV